MQTKYTLISGITLLLLLLSSSVFACGGEDSGKHFGQITSVNPSKSTFTIRDAETRSPITFQATKAMLDKAKSANGSVVVNFEENADGLLEATEISS